MITTLIDKQDNFEVVRDKIAQILANEVAEQKILAVAASKDPNDWDMKIFTERSNPWEQFLNDPPPGPGRSPIINVWFDSETFPQDVGGTVERQRADGLFNIDCYGYAVSADVVAGGHNPGDKAAALEAQRAFRLVRNILMAAVYTYLDLRGVVAQRWPQSAEVFQPEINGRATQPIVAARFVLRVSYNEFSPQVVPETLELVSVDVKRAEDGSVVAETDYDFTI